MLDAAPGWPLDATGQVLEKLFTLGNCQPAFVTAGVMCLVAALLMRLAKAPRSPRAAAA